jgi:ankyrin repeat protein
MTVALILASGAVEASQASAKGGARQDGFASFLETIKRGNIEEARQRLDQTPAFLTQRDGRFGATALHWAAAEGNLPVATLLLERGADPCAKNSEGLRPSEVAMNNGRTGIAIALRCSTEPLESLLFGATKAGDLSTVVQVLDLMPTAVHSVDTLGATPLHWAAYKGLAAITAFLLDNGADATARNLDGKTALDVAVGQQSDWAMVNRSMVSSRDGALLSMWDHRLGSVAMNQQLSQQIRQEGLARDVSGRYDAVIGDLQRPEWQRPPGSTVLKAARQGDMVVLRRLLRSNPALARVTDPASGGTLLHAGATASLEAVSFLLAQGVDTAALDKAGKTALQIAQDSGRSDIVEALRLH